MVSREGFWAKSASLMARDEFAAKAAASSDVEAGGGGTDA